MTREKRLGLVLLLAILYLLSGQMSLELLVGNKIVNIGVFIPEGIALAFALYFGRFVLVGIFLGQLLLAFYNDIGFMAAVSIGVINSLEAYLAIVLVSLLHIDIRLKSYRDIIGLMVIILFVLQPFSALSSNSVLMFLNIFSADTFLHNSFSWWFGNIMGQMLITPFLLRFFTNYNSLNLQEFFLYGFAFLIYSAVLELAFVIVNPFLLMSLTLPVVIITIFRRGLVYGLFLNVILALISSYTLYQGIGAFQSATDADNVINYNLFVLTHIIIALTVGILYEKNKRYESHLEEMVQKELKKNQQQQLFLMQQSRLAQMGEMISMIAHQWRQPLNNLSMINQYLLVQYKRDKLDQKAINYFKENSQKQIKHMSDTIDDFRNFFTTNKEKEYFCLDSVVESVLEMTKPLYTKENIEVEFFSEVSYAVYGRRNEFVQALINIINNAKDALILGNIEKKKISIKITKNRQKKLLLLIEDNAGGIKESNLPHIFEPYFSTKEAKNGTGLGLYMSKMIIERFEEAQLLVYNTNQGACFVISLEGVACNEIV